MGVCMVVWFLVNIAEFVMVGVPLGTLGMQTLPPLLWGVSGP